MSSRRPWYISFPLHTVLALAAALLIGLFILMLRLPVAEKSGPKQGGGLSIDLKKLDQDSANALLREESMLRDPTPLFLPTALNSTQAVHPENGLREPGDSYRVEPKLVFERDSIPLLLPDPVKLPAKTADELGRTFGDRPLVGLGERDLRLADFPKRSAVIEIVAAGTGEVLLSYPLEDIKLQDVVDWRPCEFLVRTDAAGMVGEPPLVASSGSDAVDQSLKEVLVRQWVRFERLAKLGTGTYRISIGP